MNIWLDKELLKLQEQFDLSDYQVKLLKRYAKAKHTQTELMIERCLSFALMLFNKRYVYDKIPNKVINYYYYN